MISSQSIRTLPELLSARVKSTPEELALFEKNISGEWASLTWKEFQAQVHAVSVCLLNRGIKAGDRVAVLLSNTIKWEILHHAILRIGGVIVGLEKAEPAERLGEIFDVSKPTAFFADSPDVVKFLSVDRRSSLKVCVSIRPVLDPDWGTWKGFLETPVTMPLPAEMPDPKQPATLIFTSGTTGKPKGILYNHEQMILAAFAIGRSYEKLGTGLKFICWLPLAALFQRMGNISAIISGGKVYFLDDHRLIMETLRSVSPDVFIGVPRFYEKLWSGLEAKVAKAPWPMKLLVQLSIRIGGLNARRLREGKRRGWILKLTFHIAEFLFLKKIRSVMGSHIKVLFSGSAAIPLRLLENYHAIGLLILEAYGLSENIVPVAMNQLDDFRFGTVGKVLLENEVRLADENVIQVKGPGLFSGYYEDVSPPPINEDGFYETGDFGEFELEFLKIKGRKAELIKTSSGRRVSPVMIEAAYKNIPLIDHIVVFGHGHKRLIAIITLNSDLVAQRWHFSWGDDPPFALRETLLKQLKSAAQSLASHEQPAGYIVLQHPFSIVSGEVTSSLKLRRKNIQDRYGMWMNEMFVKVDREDLQDPLLNFVSESQIRQAAFKDVKPQTEIIASTFRRTLRILYMAFRVAEIRFLAFLPHWDIGEAWARYRHHHTLIKIARVIHLELSHLKGPAAKLGQMASYVAESVPFPIRKSLAKLQDSAIPLSSAHIVRIVEESLGAKMDSIYAEWDNIPLAVASMSQVHKARLKTGEVVVVKVIYPQARKFTQGDIKTLQVIFPLLGKVMGILNAGELMKELMMLFEGECDLSREAINQDLFRRIFADQPAVMIPKVYFKYSSKDVLTMEYINGLPYEQFKTAADQSAKNRAGEVIFSVTGWSICRYGIFNADPHPGNYLFVGDKVCFLDFGFVRHWPVAFIDLWKQQSLMSARNDAQGFAAVSKELGFRGKALGLDYVKLMKQFQALSYKPWQEDRRFRFTKDFISAEISKIFFYGENIGPVRIPPEFVAISRLFSGQYSILADLEAEANWHRILVPMLEAKTIVLPEIEK